MRERLRKDLRRVKRVIIPLFTTLPMQSHALHAIINLNVSVRERKKREREKEEEEIERELESIDAREQHLFPFYFLSL